MLIMKSRSSKTTRIIAFCSIFSAISVVFNLIGMIFPTSDLVAALLASYTVIITVAEVGRGYAIGVYFSAAILSLIISPQNSAALFFTAFIGYYPILKSIIEVNIRRKLPAVILKIFCFNVALTVILFVAVKFLSFEEFIGWYAVGLVVLSQVAFILYDIALTRVIFLYFRFFRHRIGINKFLK